VTPNRSLGNPSNFQKGLSGRGHSVLPAARRIMQIERHLAEPRIVKDEHSRRRLWTKGRPDLGAQPPGHARGPEPSSAGMPYASNSDLPPSVREHLPTHAQDIFREAFEPIHRAGMAVKKLTARNKADLAVTPGPVPGTAHLVAKSAGHRSAYEWQYSLDQKTWTAMPVTLQAKTDVSGLTSGTTYAFRFRPVLKAGEATWSQVGANRERCGQNGPGALRTLR
jgi:cation transport regulator ChaB